MLCTGKVFATNEEVLFEQRIHYSNTSIDSIRMAKSEAEVVRILEQTALLGKEDLDKIRNTIVRVQTNCLKDNEKCKKMFRVLSDWMTLREKGRFIGEFLEKRGIHSVIIYGYGHFGRHLFSELEKSNVEIGGIIDRNVRYIDANAVIRTLDDDVETIDVVIVALLKDENRNMIEENIIQKTGAILFWITDIISEMLAEINECKCTDPDD